MGGNFERWNWDDSTWTCASCKAGPAAAKHAGKRGEESHPYNDRQAYCSAACAAAGKALQQQARRAAAQKQKLAGWRCATCAKAATNFTPGKRATCSEECAAIRRADLQQERRWAHRAHEIAARLGADADRVRGRKTR